jgi:dolichyldiphosphatase
MTITLFRSVVVKTVKTLKQIIKQPRPNGPKRHVKQKFKKHQESPSNNISSAVNASDNVNFKVEYGMPSSHSGATSFFAVYGSLALLSSYPLPLEALDPVFWTSPKAFERAPLKELSAFFFATGLILFSILVAWSRVRIGYHTVAQVVVGYLVGTTVSYLWWTLWNGFVSKVIQSWLETDVVPFAQYLNL